MLLHHRKCIGFENGFDVRPVVQPHFVAEFTETGLDCSVIYLNTKEVVLVSLQPDRSLCNWLCTLDNDYQHFVCDYVCDKSK